MGKGVLRLLLVGRVCNVIILFINSENNKFDRPVEISDELLKEEEACSKTPDDPLDQLVLCGDVVDP